MSEAEKQELLALLELKEKERMFYKLRYYQPYPKQLNFHNDCHRERLLMAANQVGKTYSGAAEMAYHLTGLYPSWWEGIKFDKPIVAWAGSVTRETTRDTVQRLLLGRSPDYGSGLIPLKCIKDIKTSQGIANAISIVTVEHVTGGTSTLVFKSYDQGREKWQGDTIHIAWLDEEPPEEIYFEALTRTNATQGIIMMTFTPLFGMSEVVRRYLINPPPDTSYTQMTIDDAGHYTDEQKATIIASYPAHEVEARTKGTPVLGSGRVFPVTEDSISIQPFDIPESWPIIAGIDFGWNHPTAAIKLAWDRDADCVYITAAYRVKEATPIVHAGSLRSWGEIPWAWPHDGLQHDKGSGEQLATIYREQKLNFLPERAQYPDGGSGLEASIMDCLQRMQTNRLKVFAHLNDWFEEFRMYHRKNGLIVKEKDDLMSATRYAIMCLRFAQVKADTAPLNYDTSWIM
jgi:phage terminase large subunit-like protein